VDLETGETEQTLDVAQSRRQGETELARALNRTKFRRPMRSGNRTGTSPSLQYIEGAQNLRKACRAFEAKQFVAKTAAADASEWQGGAQDKTAHRTQGPLAVFYADRIRKTSCTGRRGPGSGGRDNPIGPYVPIEVVRSAQPRSCRVKKRRPAQAAKKLSNHDGAGQSLGEANTGSGRTRSEKQ